MKAKAYRSRSRLVLDVLRAIRSEGEAQVTRLLLLANLTHQRLGDHLGELTAKGWVAQKEEDGRRSWSLTDLGRKALVDLEKIETAMQDFGLDL